MPSNTKPRNRREAPNHPPARELALRTQPETELEKAGRSFAKSLERLAVEQEVNDMSAYAVSRICQDEAEGETENALLFSRVFVDIATEPVRGASA